MAFRLRKVSPVWRALGIAAIVAVAVLVGIGSSTRAAGPGSNGYKSVPGETLVGESPLRKKPPEWPICMDGS